MGGLVSPERNVAPRAVFALAVFAISMIAAGSHPAARQRTQLSAKNVSGMVYVDFDVDPSVLTSLGPRLDGSGPTMVAWLVELRRVTPNWPNWPRQPTKRVALQDSINRTAEGKFVVVRRLNGEQVDRAEDIGRQDVSRLLSAFRLPVFDSRGVEPGPYEVVIRVALSGGGLRPTKSGVLARADVHP